MNTFYTSAPCKSFYHCETCRAKTPLGRIFRRNMGIGDEACPHGIGWGAQVVSPKTPNTRSAEHYKAPVLPWWKRWWRRLTAIWSPPSRGLGDTVAKMTKTVGITPCGGCKKRQKDWNEKFPNKKAQALETAGVVTNGEELRQPARTADAG